MVVLGNCLSRQHQLILEKVAGRPGSRGWAGLQGGHLPDCLWWEQLPGASFPQAPVPLGCCSDPTQQLSSPFLPTSALHCFPLTSFKSLSSLFGRCSGIWGSRDPGLRPCPPTPHSLCPLSSTHPVPKLQGLLSPHFLSLAPLFSAPSSAPASPVSPQPREASPVVPGIRAARELLYLWIRCSSTPSLVLLSLHTEGAPASTRAFFAAF